MGHITIADLQMGCKKGMNGFCPKNFMNCDNTLQLLRCCRSLLKSCTCTLGGTSRLPCRSPRPWQSHLEQSPIGNPCRRLLLRSPIDDRPHQHGYWSRHHHRQVLSSCWSWLHTHCRTPQTIRQILHEAPHGDCSLLLSLSDLLLLSLWCLRWHWGHLSGKLGQPEQQSMLMVRVGPAPKAPFFRTKS